MVEYLTHEGISGHKMKNFFVRMEFQKRGSPHIHLLVWLENMTKDDLLNMITCGIPSVDENPVLNALVIR